MEGVRRLIQDDSTGEKRSTSALLCACVAVLGQPWATPKSYAPPGGAPGVPRTAEVSAAAALEAGLLPAIAPFLSNPNTEVQTVRACTAILKLLTRAVHASSDVRTPSKCRVYIVFGPRPFLQDNLLQTT